MSNSKSSYNFRESLKEYAAGAISAWTQTILAYPLDVVKSRMQISSTSYGSSFDCFKFILKNEGYQGFFRGMLNPLILMSLVNSMYFGSIDALKRQVRIRYNMTNEEIPLKTMFCIAGLAACYSDILLIPVERIKIKLQVQNNCKKIEYSGSFNATWKIIKQGGIKTLYKSGCVSLVRDFLGCGTFFVTYEKCKRFLQDHPSELTGNGGFIETAGCGMLSGWSFWMIAYPFDIIRARYQGDSVSNPKYKGYKDVVKSVLEQKGGQLNFYRGITVTLMMSSVYSSSCMYTWEVSKQFMDNVVGNFE